MKHLTESFVNETRMSYPETEVGVRVEGRPFVVDFEEPLDDVEAFIDTICTAESPWYMFGVHHEISGEMIEGPYYSVAAVLFPTDESGDYAGKLDLEVWDKSMRVYVKESEEDLPASRVVEFVEQVDDEFGLTIPEEELEARDIEA